MTNSTIIKACQKISHEIISQDEQQAITQNITFNVATKLKKGQPWIYITEGIEKLSDALTLAYDIDNDNKEVAIFAMVGKYGGFIYWSSKSNVFNSPILYIYTYNM